MARTQSNIEIRKVYPGGDFKLPIAKATEVGVGDLIDVTTGNATIHAGDASKFAGVAKSASSDTDVAQLGITGFCDIYVPLASGSAALAFGNAALYSAGDNTTDWELTKGTAEGVAWAIEAISAGASGRFRVNVQAMAGGLLFETLTT